MVSIPSKALVRPTVAPMAKLPFVDKEGALTEVGKQFLQQHYNQTAGANRVMPCNSSNNGNQFVLNMQVPKQFTYTNYATHDTFGFVAPADATGSATALVQTSSGSLAEIPIYKTNGSAAAGAGDIVANLHYLLTYVDALNGGNGGFVIR